MSVWCCLRSAVFFLQCVILDLGVGEGVDITPYSVINILFYYSLYDTYTKLKSAQFWCVLMAVRSNGRTSKCSIPFTCAKHLQETAKKKKKKKKGEEREVIEP